MSPVASYDLELIKVIIQKSSPYSLLESLVFASSSIPETTDRILTSSLPPFRH